MRAAAIVIVALGFASTAMLAMTNGLDATGAIILSLVVGTGILAIAIARKARVGSVEPAKCPSCRGLISPNAPYCKHCGADVSVG